MTDPQHTDWPAQAQAHLQMLRALTRPDATEALALVDWLLRLLRFLAEDLPAIVAVERDWGSQHVDLPLELPDNLADIAAAVQSQNEDLHVRPGVRAANNQAARVLRALDLVLQGRDPAPYLPNPAEAEEAAGHRRRAQAELKAVRWVE